VLTSDEASRVIDLIRPCFDVYVRKYNERKYPSSVYRELLRAFSSPEKLTAADIRNALVWKFGHFGKANIPNRHEELILFVQQRWNGLSSALSGSTAATFDQLDAEINAKKRYITLTFLLHLLRPSNVPIIDQHNFRAINYYVKLLRPLWRRKSNPSTYDDLTTLSSFLSSVISQWKATHPSTVPSKEKLDRFLMMFGKGLKQRKRRHRAKR
jgi:hypothetical protein